MGFESLIHKKIDSLEILFDRSSHLNHHLAYTFIKFCLFVPEINFLSRTGTFWKFTEVVNKLDGQLKLILEKILNVIIKDKTWIQVSLPINQGGLGIRQIEDICLPAFLSSVSGSSLLVSSIFSSMDMNSVSLQDEALNCWKINHGG